MLDALRRGQRWIMPAILVGIGVPFAVYFGAQGSNTAPVPGAGNAIELGDRRVTTLELQRAIDQQLSQYRSALGDQFDEKAAMPFIVRQAASGVLRTTLLAHVGEGMGLGVSDDELRAFVAMQPWSKNEAGQYDPEQVKAVIEQNFGSQLAFNRQLSDDLLAAKTARLIESSVAVSDAETRDAIRYGREEVQILAVRLDGATPRPDLEVPEDAGKALLAKDPERVRKAVEERRSQLDTPEQVKARHILVSLAAGSDDATKAAARAKIEAADKRVKAGEDFATVAKEVSEDPGSRESGGDLGFFGRGAMVTEFETAAFALDAGELSGIVESPFGLHLIKVEEKKAAATMPYSEASAKVAQDLARTDAAAAVAKGDADALAAAVKGGQSLEDAARAKSLPILRPPAFRRNPEGIVPELGASPDLMTAAFTLTKEKPSDATVYTLGENSYALIQLLDRKGPTDAEVEAGVATERQRVLEERRRAVESAWLEGERKRLEAPRCLVGERLCLPAQLRVDLSAFLDEPEAVAGASAS
jgi:peptidyl-prolyl cis-trans isomerase D